MMDGPVPPPWVERLRTWCRRVADGDYARAGLRESLLPYVAACSPLVVTTVLAPSWLAWAMALPSMLALFHVASALDDTLFAVPAERGFLAYLLPLNLLMLAWCTAMGAAGRAGDIPTTAFTYGAVLCVVVAPAVRKDRTATARRRPLRWTFVVVASIAVALHGLAAFGGAA